MSPNEFTTLWNEHYPQAYPLGHELKWIYPERWFRIHSLPGSKRYAENELEFEIISQRQNALMESLFTSGTDILIIFSIYSDELEPPAVKDYPVLKNTSNLGAMDLHKLRPEHFEEECYQHLFVKETRWEMNAFDDILFAVADNEYSVLFFSPGKNCIAAPYDGGVDVITSNSEEQALRKQEFKSWLSEREDGM